MKDSKLIDMGIEDARIELEKTLPPRGCAECGCDLNPKVSILEDPHPDGQPYLWWSYLDHAGNKASKEGSHDSVPAMLMLCHKCASRSREEVTFAAHRAGLVRKCDFTPPARICSDCGKDLAGVVEAWYEGGLYKDPDPDDFELRWAYSEAGQSGPLDESVPAQMECLNCRRRREHEERLAKQIGDAEQALQITRRSFPPRFKNASMDDLNAELASRLRGWWTDEPDSWCLLVTGDVGRGKTHAAYALLAWTVQLEVDEFRRSLQSNNSSEFEVPGFFNAASLERCKTACWPHPVVRGAWHPELPAHLDTTEYADLVRSQFDDDDSLDYLVGSTSSLVGLRGPNDELIKHKGLLLLDDFGAQRSTHFVDEELYRLINGRYKAHRRTIVTTNMNPDTIPRDNDKARLISRMTEGTVIRLTGEDRRRTRRNDG